MKMPSVIEQVLQQERVNFFLTNRVPRRLLTRFIGRFSRIEQPIVRDVSIAVFALFAGDLRLDEAKKASFTSLHDCFVRELKEGARPIDPDPSVLVSPCDAIVGASGTVIEDVLLQVKGFPYTLEELLCNFELAARYRNGCYATLRLTAGMYHRFHAPYDCRVSQVTHIAGDAWNVNPSALKRVEKIYCKNERASAFPRHSFGREGAGLDGHFTGCPPTERRGDGLVRAGLYYHRARPRRL